MTQGQREVLIRFFSNCISHVEEEIREMENAVKSLEKPARDRIMNALPEGERWRGLAGSEFTSMVDDLALLIGDDVPTTGFAGASVEHQKDPSDP